ncbi:MAG TPA: hypothetical protein VJT83_01330 [Chitinophagaceae bacterium]|nr:hypothetical protein [Chitinophagaceae bacterium]
MRINLQPRYMLTIACIAAFVTASIAWSGDPLQTSPKQIYQDTVPAKTKAKSADKQYKKDFDKEIADLDKAMKDLENMPDINFDKLKEEIDQAMKQVQLDMSKHKIEMERLQQELKETFSKVNMEKMQDELRLSMKELDKMDVAKMKAEMQQSLKELDKMDHAKMKAEMQQSLKELDKLDLEKMKKELSHAMEEVHNKVNVEQMHKELEMMKKVDMDKVKKDLEKAHEELQKNKEHMKIDMGKAREEIAKAKIDLQNYKSMVAGMEADGLINTNEDYKIEYNDGELIINGKKQPESVTDKYKKYFRKNTTIRKQNGEMNINIQ